MLLRYPVWKLDGQMQQLQTWQGRVAVLRICVCVWVLLPIKSSSLMWPRIGTDLGWREFTMKKIKNNRDLTGIIWGTKTRCGGINPNLSPPLLPFLRLPEKESNLNPGGVIPKWTTLLWSTSGSQIGNDGTL